MTQQMDLDKSEVKEAVNALKKLLEKMTGKPNFLEEQQKINLQFAMKKVPKVKNKTIKLALPHDLATQELDVCLFVKDLNRKSREHEITEDHFKDLLVDKGVTCITQIIPLKALKLEYKPFEAKRNLSNMYDVFLADERIVRLLPSLLGKSFYGRKSTLKIEFKCFVFKTQTLNISAWQSGRCSLILLYFNKMLRTPVQVNLKAKDLKKEVSTAISSGRCILKGRGSSSMATIAHTNMTTDQIVDNIIKSANQISAAIPGGATNIRNFYIKTESSMAIPVYVSLEDASTVQLPVPPRPKNRDVIDEITTVINARVKVKPFGDVEVIRENENNKKNVQKKRTSKSKVKRLKLKKKRTTRMARKTLEKANKRKK